MILELCDTDYQAVVRISTALAVADKTVSRSSTLTKKDVRMTVAIIFRRDSALTHWLSYAILKLSFFSCTRYQLVAATIGLFLIAAADGRKHVFERHVTSRSYASLVRKRPSPFACVCYGIDPRCLCALSGGASPSCMQLYQWHSSLH